MEVYPVTLEIMIILFALFQLFVNISVFVIAFWIKALVAQSLDSLNFQNPTNQIQVQSEYMKYVSKLFMYCVVAFLILTVVNALFSLFQQRVNISSLINIVFASVLTWQMMNIAKFISEYQKTTFSNFESDILQIQLKQLETDVYNYIIVQCVAFLFLIFFQVHDVFNQIVYQQMIHNVKNSLNFWTTAA